MDASQYEKLGAFYLGREWHPEAGLSEAPLLYDAKDLTTHALVVGMTGSGKTGLSVGLLEEAAIDGVPAIVIDPKGDLGNLLLTFPDLEPGDFEPWVDPGAASRAGKTVAEHAADTAALWRRGLSEWGQEPSRIGKFRDSVDVSIYTPGSSAGLPLSVLRSFSAPAPEVIADSDGFAERIQVTVSGLLALLGMQADPVTSREHVLLSNILSTAWKAGRSLDLAGLIVDIQNPPFQKLGVLELDTFYPAADRMALAMKLNNLLASPGFAAWMTGEPLDAGRLLYRPDGRPRISVISIAHLSDSERMFVVTLVLNEVLSWMRQQPGTSSLRALLYMDEIYGFFPPSAMPPCKTPMLTLLKQARAFGLGVVLATQNPVDLDYKGLSNCGTWFIGRLQTERDKARVLDGLESAAQSSGGGGFDRAELDDVIGSLGKRVFLMNNVHEDAPCLFQTRWVLSYLRGPLVRDEIERLMAPRRQQAAKAQAQAPVVPSPQQAAVAANQAQPVESEASQRPLVAEGIEQLFVAPEEDPQQGARLLLRPVLLGEAQLHFKNATAGVDDWREVMAFAPIAADARRLDWEESTVTDAEFRTTNRKPGGFSYASLPAAAGKKKVFVTAEKRLKTHLYQTQSLTFYAYKPLKLKSKLGESEGEFRQRVVLGLSEQRDLEVEKLRARFAKSIESVAKKLRTAEQRYDRETSQLRDRKLQTAVTIGSSILGAVFGRRLTSKTSGAARAIRDLGRSRREKDDVSRAEENVEALQAKLQELEQEAQEAIQELQNNTTAPADVELSSREVRPMKGDLAIDRLAILWVPWQIDRDGVAQPLFANPRATE